MTARDEAAALREVLAEQRDALVAQAAEQQQRIAASTDALVRLARLESTLDPGTPPMDPPPVVVDPPTEPVSLHARVGSATYPIAAVNPVRGPGRDFDGGRAADELVLYTLTGRTGTNSFGAEVVLTGGLSGGTAGVAVVGAAGGLAVTQGRTVLSGHGAGGRWLRANVRAGVRVDIEQRTAPVPPGEPGPVVPPATGGSRAGNIAAWAMLWPNSPRFDWAAIPDEVDEVRLSFLVGAGKLVGYGPWGGKPKLQEGMRGFLAKRPTRFISWALGGGGQTVSVPSVDAYVSSVRAVEEDLFTDDDGVVFGQFGGGNVDWENKAFRAAGDSIAAVLRVFKKERPGFHCSWSPNSSFRDDYVAVCRENLDVVDALGYQCYDVNGLTYMGGVRPNVQDVYRDKFAGIPAGKLEVAMMIEPGRNDRWTLAQCTDAATRLRDEFGVTQTAFWEAGMAAFPGWAAAMRRINPTPVTG